MRRYVGALMLCGSVSLVAGLSLRDTVPHAVLVGWSLGLVFTLAASALAVVGHLRGE